MATVPSNPSFGDIISVFGGSGSFVDYYRGGPYVPDIPANAAIAREAINLQFAQFPGATNYVPLSASTNDVSSSASFKGSYTVGTSVCNVSGGNGNLSFSLTLLSGTSFQNTVSGNQATFRATNTTNTPETVRAVYRWTVSDGISSAIADFRVNWN